MINKKHGVLLVNHGTIDAPTSSSVRRFLKRFLTDHRVIHTSPWLWYPLLYCIILPLRSPRVAKLYRSIWMKEGAPLLVYSEKQRVKLEKQLGIPVELGMSYSQPTIKDGIHALINKGVEKITILPSYPQYSATTTAAVSDAVGEVFSQLTVIPEYHLIAHYHSHPLYIKALAEKVRASWKEKGKGERLICSYHGLPQTYVDKGDIYSQHCEETTRLLMEELQLTDEEIILTYQSNFGKGKWLTPSVNRSLSLLTEIGIKKVDIIAPALACDCLETLEELAKQEKDHFIQSGGEEYNYISCLNDSDLHIQMMEALILNKD